MGGSQSLKSRQSAVANTGTHKWKEQGPWQAHLYHPVSEELNEPFLLAAASAMVKAKFCSDILKVLLHLLDLWQQLGSAAVDSS